MRPTAEPTCHPTWRHSVALLLSAASIDHRTRAASPLTRSPAARSGYSIAEGFEPLPRRLASSPGSFSRSSSYSTTCRPAFFHYRRPSVDLPILHAKRRSHPLTRARVASPPPGPATMSIVLQRYRAARSFVLGAATLSAATCAGTSVGWWAFLPLVVAQLELVARLYDHGVLGRVKARPSPPERFKAADGVYTWQELAQHNTEESAWIAVDGAVYDVTAFVDRHPGGREMLLLALGREATDLFNSYHPFTDAPRAVLRKYRIGSLATYEHPIYKPDSGFYKEACAALKKYFAENRIDSKDPHGMILRMAPVYAMFISAYCLIYAVPGLPLLARMGLAVLMGACQGMPLTGWMHDASHASIGRTERWWWNVGRFALDYFSGSSMLSWRNQHVIGHHVYTNVMGADPDLPSSLVGDPRRLVHEQPWVKMYKWQHIYLPPLYGILGLKSRLSDVFEVFSQLTNGPIRVNPISVQDYLRLVSSKSVWAFYRFVVPLVFLSVVSAKELAILFICTEFTTGYWLAFNFQVSHISEDVDYFFSDHKKRESGKCPGAYEQEWAETQIKTTVDYAHDDPLAAYFSGALNYQTVHHLFPTVSQAHYPKITPMIMEIAGKYGYKFNVYNNFGTALGAHLSHLRKMGLEGRAAELKLE